MAYKKVSGSRTAEIQLDGSVYTVNFGYSYNYYAVRNDSSGTIYVSTADKSCTPNNDGVVSIPSGGGYVHYNGFGGSSEIYISGTGGVLVVAQDDGVCPFKPRAKGGDEPLPAAFLPHSEGLTYYFDFENGADPVQKIWRDQIRGLELPLADTQPGDALTTANPEFSVPESSGQWAYTYYVISKCRSPSDWKTIIGSYGTALEFNLACRYGKYWIGTGSAGGQMSTSVSVSDSFTVNCLNFSNGFGEWYCSRHSMTKPVGNYTSYHAPNNDHIRIGSNIDFKAIAIFKNISQGRGLILENIAFLKDKFQIN